MDKLTMDDAMALAGSLVTVGHPFSQIAIQATALDLLKWCKGKVEAVDGMVVTVSPKKQAEDLIDAARNWEGGWPERGGTQRLRALFHELFPAPGAAPKWTPLSYEQTVARGLIRPPCNRCDDTGYIGKPPDVEFCLCRIGLHQKDWEGERGLQRINAPLPERKPGTVPTFPTLTYDQMKQALDEAERRKRDQLGRLGLD